MKEKGVIFMKHHVVYFEQRRLIMDTGEVFIF